MDNIIEFIKIEDIIPSKFKSRINYDDLEGLSTSIQNYGIIQPILVRPSNGKYEIVLGERRYESALKIGIKQIPAIIKKLNDKEVTEYIILDNIQRKNFNKEEINTIYKHLKNKYNIDKYYISSNLGLNDNSSDENIDSNSQLNLPKKNEKELKEEKQFKEKKTITFKEKDVINLEELNNEDIEREDFIMNNEMLNNNNLNNIGNQSNDMLNTNGVSNTSAPTFGGRFFPSLEDEQTNMGLNTGITMPENNEAQQQPSPMPAFSNPQLEPTATILNPTANNIPNSLEPEFSIKVDNLEKSSSGNNQENGLSTMPDLSGMMNEQNPELNIESPTNPLPESIVSENPTPSVTEPVPSIEVPSLEPSETPIVPTPASVVSENPTPSVTEPVPSIEVPSLEPSETPIVPTPANVVSENPIPSPMESIPSIEVPSSTIQDNIQNIEQPNIDSNLSLQNNQTLEKKDIAPAINTIKSILDTLSQLGYNLNSSETDNDTNYNITIEIQK